MSHECRILSRFSFAFFRLDHLPEDCFQTVSNRPVREVALHLAEVGDVADVVTHSIRLTEFELDAVRAELLDQRDALED